MWINTYSLLDIPGISWRNYRGLERLGINYPTQLFGLYLQRTNYVQIETNESHLRSFHDVLVNDAKIESCEVKRITREMKCALNETLVWAKTHTKTMASINFIPGIYIYIIGNFNMHGITTGDQLYKLFTNSMDPVVFVQEISHYIDKLNAVVIAYAFRKRQEQIEMNERKLTASHIPFLKSIFQIRENQKKKKEKEKAIINLWIHEKQKQHVQYKPWSTQCIEHYDNSSELQALDDAFASCATNRNLQNDKLTSYFVQIEALKEKKKHFESEKQKYTSWNYKDELEKLNNRIINFSAQLDANKKHKLNVTHRNTCEAEIYGRSIETTVSDEMRKIDEEICRLEKIVDEKRHEYTEKHKLIKINYDNKVFEVDQQINKLKRECDIITTEIQSINKKIDIIEGAKQRQLMRSQYEQYAQFYNIPHDKTKLDALVYSCNTHRLQFILEHGSHGDTPGYLCMIYCSENQNLNCDEYHVTPIMCEGYWTANKQCGCGNSFRWNLDRFDACDTTQFSILSNRPYGKVEVINL